MSTTSRQNLIPLVGTSILALACVAAIGILQVPQLQELQRRSETPSVEILQQQSETQKDQLNLLKNIPTLGFDNIVADWVFLNFLQYFGDEPARKQTNYSLSPDFFEAIIPRNPRFLAAYTFLSTSTAMYAGMPERSIALMSQGLNSLTPTVPPQSYFVWRSKGIDELLFLGDAQAARRSFERSAEWATLSKLSGSAEVASLSRQTAQFLARNPNSKTAQVAAWAMVLTNAPDTNTQRMAANRIEALGGRVVAAPDGSFRIVPPASD